MIKVPEYINVDFEHKMFCFINYGHSIRNIRLGLFNSFVYVDRKESNYISLFSLSLPV